MYRLQTMGAYVRCGTYVSIDIMISWSYSYQLHISWSRLAQTARRLIEKLGYFQFEELYQQPQTNTLARMPRHEP